MQTTGKKMIRHSLAVWIAGLVVIYCLAIYLAIWVGPYPIAAGDVMQILGHHVLGFPQGTSWSKTFDAIIWQVRVPRVLLASSLGAGLALSGIVIQSMIRNILAEPYLLGISSGASTGAALAILLGLGTGILGHYALQAMAFAGAMLACLLVFSLAYTGGRFTSLRLLLAGVAVGYALNSLTSFIIFAAGDAEGARSVMFWLLGSLSLASWDIPLFSCLAAVLCAALLFTLLSKQLDILALGDETALTMGISAGKLRIIFLILVSLCIGIFVSAAGSIGFVGLMIPHLARWCVGESHRRAIPVAALLGAILLVIADLFSRTILAPQEIPIGVLTALLGAPFLVILIRSSRIVES